MCAEPSIFNCPWSPFPTHTRNSGTYVVSFSFFFLVFIILNISFPLPSFGALRWCVWLVQFLFLKEKKKTSHWFPSPLPSPLWIVDD